jgi:glycine/D-amino acid oxidase-like deaminating enzyme/nitrite reductase/ring-hydroxylating ferredoxin subunit
MARATKIASSSYWLESGGPAPFRKLDKDITVDAAVVGGGITGLTAAYLLAAAGKSVAVLERGRCAQAETGQTTAHLSMVTDMRLTDLIKRVGRPHAQAAWDAGLAAVAQIDAAVRQHAIDCRFEWIDGYLHAPSPRIEGQPLEEQAEQFRQEAELAVELGFDAEFVPAVPALGTPGIRFPGQARVHPLLYLAGLVKAAAASGAQIYEHTEADEFAEDPMSVTANGRTVRCTDLILATHNPLVGVSGLFNAAVFQTKLALYTTYVIAGRVAKGQVPDALFWDTETPYHYVRVDPRRDHDFLIFGGEDHKTGQTADTEACYARLEKTLLARIPRVEISHRWSGQVIETPDGLPYIGRAADHQYVATGFAGNGMTFGTLAGMMATDAILGRDNPWRELFAPDRTALGRGLWDYIKENADYPYYMIRDRFAGAEGRTLRAVKRGQGAIIERDGQKLAVYRDDTGATTVRSAICTHLGCVVGWNAAEGTWDCPCHGSRFKTNGSVISGPAEDPLPEPRA